MEPYASMRKAIGESQFVDIGLLPHAQEVLPVLPLCNIEGLSAGLPVVLTLLRFIDYSVFSELSTDSMAQFLRALLEQRALVLHNRSVAQRRMVKFVDVRDANGLSVTELLAKGRGLLSTIKTHIAVVQVRMPTRTRTWQNSTRPAQPARPARPAHPSLP